MEKVLLFRKDKFDYNELKKKTSEELFDIWNENPMDTAFYDNMEDYCMDLNNGELDGFFAISIDGYDTL